MQTPTESKQNAQSAGANAESDFYYNKGAKIMAYELIKNHEYNSTEVKFDGVPSKEIREKLKANGFKWHKTKGVWFSRLSFEQTNAILSAENVAKIDNNSEQDNLPTAQTKPVKIFYNGIKREDNKLLKCNYYMYDNGTICVTADSILTELQSDIFPNVQNDTKPYDDYYKKDYAYIEKSHPLYRFFESAYKKMKAHDAKQSIKHMHGKYSRYYTAEDIAKQQKFIEDAEKMEDVGQPTNADLLKMDKFAEDYAKAIWEAKKAERRAEQEKLDNIKKQGEKVIEKYTELYPLQENAKDYAVVVWSEHPAFNNNNRTEENGGGKYSIKALDKILAEIDSYCNKVREEEGEKWYYKTKFNIVRDGENVYNNGRYDLGDGENGLFHHVNSYQKYWLEKEKNEMTAEEIKECEEFLDWLGAQVP